MRRRRGFVANLGTSSSEQRSVEVAVESPTGLPRVRWNREDAGLGEVGNGNGPGRHHLLEEFSLGRFEFGEPTWRGQQLDELSDPLQRPLVGAEVVERASPESSEHPTGTRPLLAAAYRAACFRMRASIFNGSPFSDDDLDAPSAAAA